MYGHIRKLAEAEKAGIEKAGGSVDLYQIPETLPQEVLTKMHAPPKPKHIRVLENPDDLKVRPVLSSRSDANAYE